MYFLASFAVYLLVTISSVQADIMLPNGTTITEAQLQQIQKLLPTTKKEKIFYHWTSYSNVIEWLKRGEVPKYLIDLYNEPSKMLQAYGPGFYMASNPNSSRGFGPACIVIKMPVGTLIYDPTIIKSVIGKELDQLNASVLGQYIPYIKDLGNNDWHLTNHYQNTKKVYFGAQYDAPPQGFTSKNFSFVFTELELLVQKNISEASYLKDFLHLAHYQDGINFIKNVLNDSNPFHGFEPEHFAFHKDLYFQMSQESNPKDYRNMPGGPFWQPRSQEPEVDWGVQHDRKFGQKSTTKSEWIKKQIHEVLPFIHNRLSKGSYSKELNLRKEGVRAGGNLQNNTFEATPVQLAILRDNKYIDVHQQKLANGNYLAHYFYPDVFHYKHLEHILSNELFSEISAYSIESLWKDESLRQKLNQRLIEDLLYNVFEKYYGTDVDNFSIIRDLISIHPFEDFNGRTTRAYSDLVRMQAGLHPYYEFLSDFDLIKSDGFYKKFLDESTKNYRSFVNDMMNEMINSVAKNETPQFHQKKYLYRLLDSLEFLGLKKDYSLTELDYHDIEKRRYNSLFRRILDKNYRSVEVFELLTLDSIQLNPSELQAYLQSITIDLNLNISSKDLTLITNELLNDHFSSKLIELLQQAIPEKNYDSFSFILPTLIKKIDKNKAYLIEDFIFKLVVHSNEYLKDPDIKKFLLSFIDLKRGTHKNFIIKLINNHEFKTRPMFGLPGQMEKDFLSTVISDNIKDIKKDKAFFYSIFESSIALIKKTLSTPNHIFGGYPLFLTTFFQALPAIYKDSSFDFSDKKNLELIKETLFLQDSSASNSAYIILQGRLKNKEVATFLMPKFKNYLKKNINNSKNQFFDHTIPNILELYLRSIPDPKARVDELISLVDVQHLQNFLKEESSQLVAEGLDLNISTHFEYIQKLIEHPNAIQFGQVYLLIQSGHNLKSKNSDKIIDKIKDYLVKDYEELLKRPVPSFPGMPNGKFPKMPVFSMAITNFCTNFALKPIVLKEKGLEYFKFAYNLSKDSAISTFRSHGSPFANEKSIFSTFLELNITLEDPTIYQISKELLSDKFLEYSHQKNSILSYIASNKNLKTAQISSLFDIIIKKLNKLSKDDQFKLPNNDGPVLPPSSPGSPPLPGLPGLPPGNSPRPGLPGSSGNYYLKNVLESLLTKETLKNTRVVLLVKQIRQIGFKPFNEELDKRLKKIGFKPKDCNHLF